MHRTTTLRTRAQSGCSVGVKFSAEKKSFMYMPYQYSAYAAGFSLTEPDDYCNSVYM